MTSFASPAAPPARRLVLAALVALTATLVAAPPAAAQPAADGPPFVLEEESLAGLLGEVRVAAAPGGETVALWVGDCPGLAVCARTWNAAGVPVAGSFALPVPVAGLAAVPALAAVPGGGFWVVWSRPGEGFAREIALQRFAADGVPGLERLAAAESAQIFTAPAVGADAAGAPVVVWERQRFEGEVGGQPVTVGVEIRGRRFAADGAALGDAFRVDEEDGDLAAAPALAVAADGGFLVAWEGFGFDPDEEDVLARRFTPGADGAAVPAGGELVVHPDTSGRQLSPAAAASGDGSFLVAWEGPAGASSRGVFAQVFTTAGPLGPFPFRVGAVDGDQRRPAAAGADGAFVILWEDQGQGGSLWGQRRDASGVPLDGGFRVDQGGGTALAPAVAALPGGPAAGGLLGAWVEQRPDFSRRLLGRRYAGAVSPPEPCAEDETTLCLGPDGRFRVTAGWATSAGDSGAGRIRPLTADTGTFWFFDPANLELVVKVLAACPVNGHHWVFAAGLTDVAVSLVVEDTATGVRRTYSNPQATAFHPVQDTAAFPCD